MAEAVLITVPQNQRHPKCSSTRQWVTKGIQLSDKKEQIIDTQQHRQTQEAADA